MVDFAKLEEDVKNVVHNVIAEVESHEPAIEDAVVAELGELGAPGAVASAVGALLAALANHFKNEQPAPAPEPEPAPVDADPNPPAEVTG